MNIIHHLIWITLAISFVLPKEPDKTHKTSYPIFSFNSTGLRRKFSQREDNHSFKPLSPTFKTIDESFLFLGFEKDLENSTETPFSTPTAPDMQNGTGFSNSRTKYEQTVQAFGSATFLYDNNISNWYNPGIKNEYLRISKKNDAFLLFFRLSPCKQFAGIFKSIVLTLNRHGIPETSTQTVTLDISLVETQKPWLDQISATVPMEFTRSNKTSLSATFSTADLVVKIELFDKYFKFFQEVMDFASILFLIQLNSTENINLADEAKLEFYSSFQNDTSPSLTVEYGDFAVDAEKPADPKVADTKNSTVEPKGNITESGKSVKMHLTKKPKDFHVPPDALFKICKANVTNPVDAGFSSLMDEKGPVLPELTTTVAPDTESPTSYRAYYIAGGVVGGVLLLSGGLFIFTRKKKDADFLAADVSVN